MVTLKESNFGDYLSFLQLIKRKYVFGDLIAQIKTLNMRSFRIFVCTQQIQFANLFFVSTLPVFICYCFWDKTLVCCFFCNVFFADINAILRLIFVTFPIPGLKKKMKSKAEVAKFIDTLKPGCSRRPKLKWIIGCEASVR